MEKVEEGQAKKRREYERKEKIEKIQKEQAKKLQEFTNKTEILENSLTNVLKKVKKMKLIINVLKRNINIDVALQKNLLDEIYDEEINTPTIILIRVENYEEGTVYFWNTETFYDRYDSMKDLFNKFNDDVLDIQNMKKEDDPLWDEGKPILLGYAFYKLEPLAYLMNNESELRILSPNGIVVGAIEIDIIPHDEEGNEFDEVPDMPNELIGQSLAYKVIITSIKNLDKNFCRNVSIEYKSLFDNSARKTKVYNQFIEKKDEYLINSNNNTNNDNNDNLNKNNNIIIGEEKVEIEINESFEHRIDYLTKRDIDILENDKICFKIYASESVEKIGKTPIEEVLNELKEKEEVRKDSEDGIKRNEIPINQINGTNDGDKKINNELEDENTKDNKKNNKNGKDKKGKKRKKECCIY